MRISNWIVAACAVTAALTAQPSGAQPAPAARQGTTGVYCLNNFCIGPFDSESTSCTNADFPGGGPTFLNVECALPNLPVFIFYSSVLPCTGDLLCLNFSWASIPFTSCGGTSNQSLDILPGNAAPIVGTSQPSTVPNCSFYSLPVNLPAGLDFSMQAVILDPVNGAPFGAGGLKVLVTQAYQVST